MGDYNPHRPYILGQEWAGIKFEPTDLGLTDEIGHSFHLETARRVDTGVWYCNEQSFEDTLKYAVSIAVYPRSKETSTGPIKQVVIPVSAGNFTGAGFFFTGSSIQNSLQNPNDSRYVGIFASDTTGKFAQMNLSFDVNSFSAQLSNKRILKVEFRTVVAGDQFPPGNSYGVRLYVPATFTPFDFFTFFINPPTSDVNPVISGGTNFFQDISLGDVNRLWDPGVTQDNNNILQPWRFQELQRLAVGGSPKLELQIDASLQIASVPLPQLQMTYAALVVTFCEEQRVAFGCAVNGTWVGASQLTTSIALGPNPMRMYNPVTLAHGVVLPANKYTLVVNQADFGLINNIGTKPKINALRELYPMVDQPGLTVLRSQKIDDEFSATTRVVLPQLSLQASGTGTGSGVVTQVHAYGTQIQAPVYTGVNAAQDIHNVLTAGDGTKFYPMTRFYARRFGVGSALPLTLTAPAPFNSSASITATDFDALPEILDGWREVNLRFASPTPSFSGVAGGTQRYTWSSGTLIGNQWQILAHDAPTVSGVAPGNGPGFFGTVILDPATYFAPSGGAHVLNWQGAGGNDTSADATLILSTDPPAVTGFAISTCSQAITGIALDCGVLPDCVPTGISGNQISWNMGVVCDTFTRVVVDGWGSADTGQAWTLLGGTVPGDYDVNGSQGTHTMGSVGVNRNSSIGVGSTDQVDRAFVTVPVVATGATIEINLNGRQTTPADRYLLELDLLTTNVVNIQLVKEVAGVQTALAGPFALSTAHFAGASYGMELRVVGSSVRGKAWQTTGLEPTTAQVTVTDTSITMGTNAGVTSRLQGGNTNTLPVLISYDNFSAVPGTLADSTFQIDRFDAVDGAFNTILQTTNLCLTSFCDFEARVGVPSIYRMRVLNAMDFAGPYVSGAGTIAAPGVAGVGAGNSTLIFTSNKAPLANLAHTMIWDGEVDETFSFPESGKVRLQDMYRKDFATAFRPLERGGERFSRTLLINAAAIPLESLANFKNLRDLAWAQLPYVCVRDELGNRWFATVIVPGGNVKRNRRLYLAQVDIIEVTDTPCAVT